ncbi:nitrogenase iron-molybdenum cofactor biosynthesis protein NifE [Calothrix sp. UHCC 0171]|uniref:nitrogenase iron-molybdenum cofactor biosynthesis protein NifE n=1 Tax=Calothrix sp. UHCC 0171 TaxID=3110245 RepID=UPI002B1F79D4|nr:nitrogenase iron-molybdenum cofactor biosynthesis protein NifE [Calothrix sp. UHCC 0171]MEA5574401.1 nitrogenase iron-molybdenum cofactor biosynthesis protein NifE [Calothrix sp. UHCC 0171]
MNNSPTPFGHESNIQNQEKTSILSQPGIVQGGCVFDSAMITLLPISDAVHIVHGSSGCASSMWGNLTSLSSNSTLSNTRFTSEIEESDIIFGGAKKLRKGILELQRRYKPSAIFVYSTCITAMIGDDIEGVCRDVREETGIPAIPVHCPGFIGAQSLGHRVAAQALLEHVIGTAEPDVSTDFDINLIGEYNIAGAIWNILPLLEKLGIRVLAKITGDARYQEICYAHRAKLNVVLSSKPLSSMAKRMQKKFDIPYIEESFYGVENTNQCLRNIAVKLGNADLQEQTEKLITEETAALDEKLAIYRAQLKNKRIVLDIGSFKSWLIIFAAKKLGMEVIPIITRDINEDGQTRIKTLLGGERIIFPCGSPEEIQQIINENQGDMLISDRYYQYSAIKTGISFLDINSERNYSYTGYVGMLEITKELYAAFSNPIWEQLHQPNPWDEEV